MSGWFLRISRVLECIILRLVFGTKNSRKNAINKGEIQKRIQNNKQKNTPDQNKKKKKGQTDETASGASREGAERAPKYPKNKTENQEQKDKPKFHLEDKWGCGRTGLSRCTPDYSEICKLNCPVY